MLRLTPSGAASWAVRATAPGGRRIKATIGCYPAVSLSEARRLALETLGRIAKGHDPVAERRAARAAREAAAAEAEALGPTVAARWQEWTEHASRSGRGWSISHTRNLAYALREMVAPALGHLPLRATTREQWAEMLTRTNRERGPGAAALLGRAVGAFLTHAETVGWVETSPIPRRAISKLAPPPAPRSRVLSDGELRLVWDAAVRLGAKPRVLTRLLILTGARAGEVAGIATGEVDLEAGEWRLPPHRSKNREGRAIPLGPLALAEIRTVWPEGEVGEGMRILGRTGAAPFSGFSKAKTALDRHLAALAAERGEKPPAPWDWHDLRRTCRTGLSRLGVPFEAAEAAIGHVVAKTALAKTYDHHRFEAEARGALLRWQAHVAAAVG